MTSRTSQAMQTREHADLQEEIREGFTVLENLYEANGLIGTGPNATSLEGLRDAFRDKFASNN